MKLKLDTFVMTSSRWMNLKADVPSTWDVLVNLGAICRSAKMIISECAEGKNITVVIMYDPVHKDATPIRIFG